MDSEIGQLAAVTSSAAAASVFLGRALRGLLRRVIGGKFRSINSFSDAATSAFILTVCSFEKMLPLIAGSELVYYVMTFLFGVAFAQAFVEFSPSPCTPLFANWKKIKLAYLFASNGQRQNFLMGFFRAVFAYVKLSASSIMGLIFGYQFGLLWLRFLWNGMMTSHHEDNLPVLDSCVECLSTGLLSGFLIEWIVTMFFLEAFSSIDVYLKQSGKSRVLGDSLKSIIVCLVLYVCIDRTGAFANPFLAYVIQRHCLTDWYQIASHTFVYAVAPFMASVCHLVMRDALRRAEKQI